MDTYNTSIQNKHIYTRHNKISHISNAGIKVYFYGRLAYIYD